MSRYNPSQVQDMSNDTDTDTDSSSSDETEMTKISSYQMETEMSSSDDTMTASSPEEDTTSSEHTVTNVRGRGRGCGDIETRKSQRVIAKKVQQTQRTTRVPVPTKTTKRVPEKVQQTPRRTRKKTTNRVSENVQQTSRRTRVPVPKNTTNRVPVYTRKWKPDTTSDSDDSSSSCEQTATFSQNVGRGRGRKASFDSGRRNIRRRTIPMPLPRESSSEDSDGPGGFEIIDNAEFRKTKSLYKAKPLRHMYDDYEDEVEEVDADVFMFHAKPDVGASPMKRPYKGDSDEDAESNKLPFERRERVDIAPAKASFARKKGRSDAASSAPLRRSNMSGESVNDNIIARKNEELTSGIASMKKMTSVEKTVEVVKPAIDISDELPSSFSDGGGCDSSGSDDSAEKVVYVSDISDSEASYSEKSVTPNNVVIEESTKVSEDCYGMERNSNTHVSISDDEPKEREKKKVPSSNENGEKQHGIDKAPQKSEEINTTFADKSTLDEGRQVNRNGEREGSSLKHVLNKLRMQEEEKDREEAVVEKLNVPLRMKQNGEKARERNEVPGKNKEVNTARANDVTNEKLRVKNNVIRKTSTTAPYPNKPHVPMGLNKSPSKNQTSPDTLKKVEAVSPAVAEDKASDHVNSPVQKKLDEANLGNVDANEETVATEDKDCDNTDNGVPKKTDEDIAEDGDTPAANRIEKRRKLKSCRDLFKMLADSVLDRAPLIENESEGEDESKAPTNTPQVALPLKFRFEDEIPKKVEKTEYEMMVAGLFDELNLALEMVQDSSHFTEANSENECSTIEETQEARCVRGLHELELEDDEGLFCIYCGHVEFEARDILPQWVQKTRCKPGRKRLADADEFPDFDEPDAESPVDNGAAFNSTDDGSVWDAKPRARESMYKHQQEGFEFLWKNLAGGTNLAELKNPKPNDVGGCIISHAPGTGKTRLTIVFIETYLKVFPDCRPVIIAPASMLLTWEEEFGKWDFPFPFHNLNDNESGEGRDIPRQFRGPGCQDKDNLRMLKIYLWNKGGSILGISYSLFAKLSGQKQVKDNKNKNSMAEKQVKDIKMSKVGFSEERIEMLRKILLEKPGLVILDEGHTPRNQSSNIWNALLKLTTEKRVILSGTPFQNNFGELFNTLKLVRPAVANVIAKDKTFAFTKKGNKSKHNQSGPIPELVDSVMLEKLKSIMSPFVNVHKGTILRESLPGLRDSVILLKPQELQERLIKTLGGHQCTFEFEHKVALISVHPYLLMHCGSSEKQDFEAEGIDINLVKASKLNPNAGVKTKFIIELLRLSTAANEKVLIFGQYVQPLELIKEQLKEVFKWVEGKQILQMKGKQHQKIRQSLMKTYNDPSSEARVMLASTKCCSEGISLVGASRVVLLDVVWNPSVERQAICRAYRIGQKKFVHTYHLMTSGTTEGDKYCRQAEKERLSELVFCSSYGESDKKKPTAGCIEDTILEKMVGSPKLTDMFEKILNQPKETDLIQTFGLT